MNYSLFKERVYGYLSYMNIQESDDVNNTISECFSELTKNDTFRYLCAQYIEPHNFMKQEPYASFLNGASGYYFFVSTLGHELDERVEQFKNSDKSKMLVFDACANAYLEMKNEELKLSLGDDISYLFCPGYQGSDASDLSVILDELGAEEIGIKLLPSGMMTPMKTMAGIYAKGVTPRKKCGNCIKINDCAYRKAGKLCFHLERK